MKKKLLLLIYYGFFQHLPMQPFPGYKVGYLVRRWLVRNILKQCGDDVVVKDKCYFGNGNRLSVGSRTQLGQNSRLTGIVNIGDDVLMGPDVVIMATSHKWNDTNININLQGEDLERPVTIGNDVWLGTRVIILPGVTIGAQSVVGAGSVVTKDFPNGSVIAGNPARLIRSRYDE